MSLRMMASRIAPVVRRSVAASSTTSNSGIMAWTLCRREMHNAAMTPASTTWSETLSFAAPESDFTVAQEFAHWAPGHERPLPRSYAAALAMEDSPEAIVITTATKPHTVVHVNHAWESLCGYSRNEALHRPIGPLLQQDKPQSHTHQAAKHLMEKLQAAHFRKEEDAYLENFTKDGRPFLNHVRVGPLYMADEDPKTAEPLFLLAVLEEVKREEVPLRSVV